MRKQLSRYTEWLWLQGKLQTAEKFEQAARIFQDHLRLKTRSYPIFEQERGLIEILEDMKKTYLVLTYGGRFRSEIPQKRRQLLEEEAHLNQWAL